jgi:excisionase family DNA binding protein
MTPKKPKPLRDREPALSLNEAAKIAHVHRNTLRNEIIRGRLRATRVGRTYRITADSFRQYLGGE